jgi:hypothetical protein
MVPGLALEYIGDSPLFPEAVTWTSKTPTPSGEVLGSVNGFLPVRGLSS